MHSTFDENIMDILDPVVSILNLCPMKRLAVTIVVGIAILIGIHHYFPGSELIKKIGPFAIGILILVGIIWDVLILRKEERTKLDGNKK